MLNAMDSPDKSLCLSLDSITLNLLRNLEISHNTDLSLSFHICKIKLIIIILDQPTS